MFTYVRAHISKCKFIHELFIKQAPVYVISRSNTSRRKRCFDVDCALTTLNFAVHTYDERR